MRDSGETLCFAAHKAMANWLDSTAHALRLFGGVQQLTAPENPKAMIADADPYYESMVADDGMDFPEFQHARSKHSC